MTEPLIVGVAGGSGSGKTTLTDNLMAYLGDNVCLVHHDNYYKAHTGMTYEERAQLNYDCPDAFDNDLLIEQLAQLRRGETVQCPVYDFTVHNRSDKVEELVPKPIILVEGILIFAIPELRDMMDIRVFVDTDADTRLARRILRDNLERQRSVESVISQWLNTVKPMYELYVQPSRQYAHVILPAGGRNPVALDMLEDRLQRHLRQSTAIEL